MHFIFQSQHQISNSLSDSLTVLIGRNPSECRHCLVSIPSLLIHAGTGEIHWFLCLIPFPVELLLVGRFGVRKLKQKTEIDTVLQIFPVKFVCWTPRECLWRKRCLQNPQRSTRCSSILCLPSFPRGPLLQISPVWTRISLLIADSGIIGTMQKN